MKLEKYDLKADESFTTFEFVSEGSRGRILKLIQYTRIGYSNLYNLAFGDKNLVTGELNDTVVSNNGDSEKVLATIVASVYDFTNEYADVWIYVIGSTGSRTRLYQAGINKFFEEAMNDFEVLGLINDEWQVFRKGINYSAFLARRKMI